MDLMDSLKPFDNIKLSMIQDVDCSSLMSKTDAYICILDGIFGYSFKGPIKSELLPLFEGLKKTQIPIFSIDVPSGWDIESGNIYDTFVPAANISLGSIKPLMKEFKGAHYFTDHFMPRKLLSHFNIINPVYEDPKKLFTILH